MVQAEQEPKLPSREWLDREGNNIAKKLEQVQTLHPEGDPVPWDGREKLKAIMEKLEVSELEEQLTEAEIMPRTDDTGEEISSYSQSTLLDGISDSSYKPLDEQTDEEKGQVCSLRSVTGEANQRRHSFSE